MTSPWCQGSLLAVPSSDSLPAGDWFVSLTCLFEAALLCSPSGTVSGSPGLGSSLWSSTWIPLESPGCGDLPLVLGCGCCRQRARTWLGAGDNPNFGVSAGAATCPAAPWPQKGAKEKWECSGTAPRTTRLPCLHCQAWGLHPIPRGCGMQPRGSGTPGSPPGPAWPAPATLGPSQARDGGGDWDAHGKPGSHWCHWYPPNSSPVLTKPSSQQGLGEVFPLFSPVFPVGHTGICVGICDPVAAFESP